MRRSVAAVGASAVAVSVVAIPVGAAILDQQVSVGPVVVAESNSQALDGAGTYSDSTLVGTGLAFLLLGAGTLTAAHRRRWRTIDVRDGVTEAPKNTIFTPEADATTKG